MGIETRIDVCDKYYLQFFFWLTNTYHKVCFYSNSVFFNLPNIRLVDCRFPHLRVYTDTLIYRIAIRILLSIIIGQTVKRFCASTFASGRPTRDYTAITDCIIYMNCIYTHYAASLCICKVCAFLRERARARILRPMIDAIRGSRREAEDDDDKDTSKWKTREVDQLGPITHTR